MMPGLGDTSLANLSEPRSIEEIAAIVVALNKAAEQRCSALSGELRTLGSPAVADLLEELGGEHGDQAGRAAQRATGGKHRDVAADDLPLTLPRILSEEAAADCDLLSLTPYKVLAFAVTLAQQSFQLYSYLAAAADDEVRDCAQRLAGEQLSRAARFRVERRRAFHAERRQPQAEGYPTAPLVGSLADLLAAALAIEVRLAERLAEAGKDHARISAACRETRESAVRLRKASEQAGLPGGPMAEELKKFSRSAQTRSRAERDRTVAARHLLADCERAFSFYDAVASAPVDEAVMLRAQDLSRVAVARIRRVRASGDAFDEAGRLDGDR